MSTSKTAITAGEMLAALSDSPDIYPQKIDFVRACVLLVRFDERSYRAASFLDDRVLGPGTQGAWLPLDRVAAAAAAGGPSRPLHFILHTGHVGSTLLSRLLDTSGCVLSLREPLPLRTLAETSDTLGCPDSLLSASQFESWLDTLTRLWSRGYPSTQSVILKATSAAARIAPLLLQRNPGARAVYLNLRAEPYLATLLAGANSALDLRGHGPERMRRLVRRLGGPCPSLHALSHGELAAMSWLAETITRDEVRHAASDRVLAIDFDDLLADLPQVTARVVKHFGLSCERGWLDGLVTNPVLTRYSKSTEHDYSPALRAQVLAESRREHAREIGRGLGWLEALARTEPLVERALQHGGR